MDERLRFVARLLDGEKMAALCREFDVSRKTGYKIYQRYKDCGLDGLTALDTSMLEWTSEAMIGDSDGYNNGRANFYLYDRPADGKQHSRSKPSAPAGLVKRGLRLIGHRQRTSAVPKGVS